MVTIATTSMQFWTVSELLTALQAHGVIEEDLRRAATNPGRVRELAALLLAEAPVVPEKLSVSGRMQLISALLPAKIDANGFSAAKRTFALYEDERERLTSTECVRELLGHLTQNQLHIVLRRSGIDGGDILTAAQLGVQMGLTATGVNRRRAEANRVMREKATDMVIAWRQAARA